MELLLTNDLNVTDRLRADADLVRSALGGNEDAFATLFHAHRTKVYSICLRMTNNTAEAEDLTQEAFLQVFRKLGTFRGDSALSTWLHRVAVNSVLMHFRKMGPRQVSLEEPANEETGAPKREHGKADDGLSTALERIALARAIKELPVGYRKIFLMHEVRGYAHHEIARLLALLGGKLQVAASQSKNKYAQAAGL